MRSRSGCGVVFLGLFFVVVACLVFVALAGALVYTGEVSIYEPRLTGLEPHPNFAFQPTTPISLTFDQPMDRASVEAAFYFEPAVDGAYHWNADSTQVTFVPAGAGFGPGTTHTVHLTADAQAATLPRTLTRPHEWSFTLPPLVDSLSPEPGTADLGPLPGLQVTFNYELDCKAAFDTFSMTPDAVGVMGCKDYTFTFSPTVSLDPGTAYVAVLEHVMLAGDPEPRPGVRWAFQTAPPLTVEEVAPSDAGFLEDLWSVFRITFNRPVVADSAISKFSLRAGDGNLVTGQVSWEQGGASLVFEPAEALRPSTEYQLALQSGVGDELGFELAEGVERSYTTPPMMGLPIPIPGTKEVPLDSTVRVPFARPMDKESVEAGLTFAPPLEGDASWDEDTLVFQPQGGLAADTVYQATVSAGVRDASGAPLGSTVEWEFATQSFLLDAQAPGDVQLTELRQPVEFTFALPMDRASVRSALTISPTTAGDLVWSEDDRTVTFQPDPGWQPGVEYEIVLSGAARTADGGQTLVEEQVYVFSTAQAEVQFGDGPNVQVMAAGGDRAFQFIARGADVADFALAPITPTQFLDLYSSNFRGSGPPGSRSVETGTLTVTVGWREALAPLDGEAIDEWRPVEAHIPADVAPGMYVLSAEPPAEQQGQLLVVLTDHALLLKRALAGSGSDLMAQIVAWDTGIGDGTPVVSSTVRLYDRDGQFLAEGETGADGLLAVEVPGDPGALLALADYGGDVTVCGLDHDWSSVGWWGWWQPPPSRPLQQIYAYTDRPIYRPEQSIFFKSFVRGDDDASYSLPPQDLPVTVRLRDARDNVVATQTLTPTQFGTVDGAFHLADEAMVGTWHLETAVETTLDRHPMQVEEYRKPEYQVLVQSPQKAYVRGEPISVTVAADYYFGGPVSGAGVRLLAYPLYADGLYEVGGPTGSIGPVFGPPLFAEEGATDDQGRWTVVLPTDDLLSEKEGAGRVLLALEATVADESGAAVSSYQTVVVQRAAQGITLLLERHGYEPNEEMAFGAAVRDRDGQPVAGVELSAQILGWDDEEVAAASATTDASGQARFTTQVADQGWYRLRVGGRDDGGRAMEAEDYLWVYDPAGQAPWYGGRWSAEPALTVGADRLTYAVGDEARVVVYAPRPGPALLTFERGETRYAEPVELISGTNLISVPIQADFGPNIYLTVNQFGPPDGGDEMQSQPDFQLHKATTQLLVPMTGQRLTVTLEADGETYAPGDEATFQVRIVDHEGQPVVAEVSLAVVDEAIYALAEDRSEDPFEALYGPRPNTVRTFDSWQPTRWLFPGAPGLGGGGDWAGGAPRRNFLDTAYWAPAVVTDEQGEAAVTFTLPDNLTEWRALARAITTDTMVGQATARVIVSQDIAVSPAVPRFLVQGDEVALSAVVHNLTAQPVSATVQLDPVGLALAGEESQVVHVPAGGSAAAAWPVAAGEAGEAGGTFQVTASRGARLMGRDAVEFSLPVYALAVPELTTFAGELAPAWPSSTLTLTLPADVITGLSRLEIHLAPSLAPKLLDGLEYLIGYPYGCVEQTMSRVLPNAAVARAFGELGIDNERLAADLPPMVDLGLQKLYGYQHPDGGWGWWYDDQTDVNQTAYVLLGLSATAQAGFDVDAGVVEQGAEALRLMLPAADPRAQAYGAYALVMAGQPVSVTLTLTEALALDSFSRAALAVALDAAGGELAGADTAQTAVDALLDSLREAAVQEGRWAHWADEGEQVAYSRTVMGSDVRTTAMVVDALVRLDPESPLLPRAVRWLMGQRRGQGWGDTQQTSFSILALTGYLQSAGRLAAGSAFQMFVNGEPFQAGTLAPAGASQVLTVPLDLLSPGENSLGLVLGAEGGAPAGRLYYDVLLSASRAPGEAGLPALRPHERSIGVQREYRLWGSETPDTVFQAGDLVEVVLTLDAPEESWYVIVDDPLPAGFEALNERLGTTSHVAAADVDPIFSWQVYGYNRKDVRDDRVSFFVTRLDPGQTALTYLARATSAGEMTALPVQVYLMYETEVWGRSAGERLRIGVR